MCQTTTSPSVVPTFNNEQRNSKYKLGIFLGSMSIFISILGASLTFPFLQTQRDKFNCNALCYGSMQSTRSGLTMVGTILVGRLSDKYGRIKVLWLGTIASMFSYLINLHGNSIEALWIALIPSALLNHNYSVLKVREYSKYTLK